MLPGKKYKPEDLLQILRRRIWMLVVPFAVVSAATAVAARKLPDYYRSETLILIVPQRVPEAYVKSTVTTRIEDRLPSIEQQILSRTHVEKIIHDFDLYADDRRNGIMQDIVERMRRDIDVQVVKGNAFRVSYVGREPRTVMKVTESLASLFINESLKDRETLAENTNQFLQTQVEDARRRLQDQERKLEAYRLRYSGQLPQQLQSNLEAMHNVQMQVQATVEAINRVGQQKLLLARQLADLQADAFVPELTAAPPGAKPPDAPGPVGGTTAQQLSYQQSVLKGLEGRGLTADHPDVKTTKNLIRDLQQKLDAEALERPLTADDTATMSPAERTRQKRIENLQADLDQLDHQIASLQSEEKRLRGVADAYQKNIDVVPARETEMTELTRDYNTLKEMYATLLQKNEESRIAENLERRQIGETFNLLDAAHLPEKPFSPNRPLINLIAMGAGLALGIGLIVLLEYKDSSFKTDEEVAGLLALPVLAVVPLMQSDVEQRRARRRRWVVRAGLGSAVAGCLAVLVYTFVK